MEFHYATHPLAARTLYRINFTSVERTEMECLERGHTTAQHIAKRARLILMANEEGLSNQDIATRLGGPPRAGHPVDQALGRSGAGFDPRAFVRICRARECRGPSVGGRGRLTSCANPKAPRAPERPTAPCADSEP